MRLTTFNFKKHARTAQNVTKVPFKQLHPLTLKDAVNKVPNKEAVSGNNCLYQMTLLFICLKDNNYENHLCNNEIEKFQNCMKEYLAKNAKQKQLHMLEKPTPGTVTFTNRQLTYLLQKYPNV